MMYETDNWPYIPAKHVGPVRVGLVRLIVIHTAETKETPSAAERIAKYFQNPDYVSSCHLAIDNTAIIQCVKDSRVAYAAPGCNSDGLQLELCCYAGQTASQWRDPYSLGLLALAADAAAQYCLKYKLPPRRLSDAELLADHAGIIGHDQASRVYKKSTHTDPGPTFPWTRFLAMVSVLTAERAA